MLEKRPGTPYPVHGSDGKAVHLGLPNACGPQTQSSLQSIFQKSQNRGLSKDVGSHKGALQISMQPKGLYLAFLVEGT